MGYWKTHKFKKKDVARGFALGVSKFASITSPSVKKVGEYYTVRVKY